MKPNTSIIEFGKLLAKLRLQTGLGQEEFYSLVQVILGDIGRKEINFGYGLISQWETGKRKFSLRKHLPIVEIMDEILLAGGELKKLFCSGRLSSNTPKQNEIKTKMKNLDGFVDLLKTLREEKGLTQTELEKLLADKMPETKMPVKLISLWETKARKRSNAQYGPIVQVLDGILEANGRLLQLYQTGSNSGSMALNTSSFIVNQPGNFVKLAKMMPDDVDESLVGETIAGLITFFERTGVVVDPTNKHIQDFVLDALTVVQTKQAKVS